MENGEIGGSVDRCEARAFGLPKHMDDGLRFLDGPLDDFFQSARIALF
jgi:hypothetical protein